MDTLTRPDFAADVAAFHEKFGLEYDGLPRVLPFDLAEFRRRFMQEELSEWSDAHRRAQWALNEGGATEIVTDELENMLDAGVDLLYVLFGTLYLQGLLPKFDEAWRRVQTANMAKVRAKRKEQSMRGSTYDVVKPVGWEKPRHIDLVQPHAHM